MCCSQKKLLFFYISKPFCRYNESIEWYFLSPICLYVDFESLHSLNFFIWVGLEIEFHLPSVFLGKKLHPLQH